MKTQHIAVLVVACADDLDGFVGGLTEEQIERRVERMTDRVDARLMNGSLTQEAYDVAIEFVNEWAEREYRFRLREKAPTIWAMSCGCSACGKIECYCP
jgi:hypothetical protein